MEERLRYVVAIDLGTARTGIAWGFTDGGLTASEVVIRTEWPGCPPGYPKTYSDLVWCREKWYYGGEAHRIIMEGTDLSGNSVKGTKDTYKQYKMNLYDKEKSKKEDLADDELLEVFSQELAIMKEIAFQNMKDQMPGFEKEDFDKQVQWVLTVPEGATEEDKGFMRKAAQEAGLISDPNKEFDRILFALEPEAAIISYMRDEKNPYFTGMTEKKKRNIIVYDAGGGTVDVTVKVYDENDRSGKLHTRVQGACEAAGSTYTDSRFLGYVEELFSKTPLNLKEYLDKDRELRAFLLREWEELKERTSAWEEDGNESGVIDISEVWEVFEEGYKDAYTELQKRIKENEDREGTRIYTTEGREYIFQGRKNRNLIISKDIFADICAPVFKKAYQPLQTALDNLQKEGLECDVICFAGGFSCNPCLREFIRKQVGKEFGEEIGFAVSDGVKMGSAVLCGAVLFGKNPGIIADRIVTQAYGTENWENGVPGCFSYFVKKGEIVSFDQTKELIYGPVYPDQKSVLFNIYRTDKNDVTKANDPSLHFIVSKEVSSPNTAKGTERRIIVTLAFGQTETKITMRDEESGNEQHAGVHMSFKWEA